MPLSSCELRIAVRAAGPRPGCGDHCAHCKHRFAFCRIRMALSHMLYANRTRRHEFAIQQFNSCDFARGTLQRNRWLLLYATCTAPCASSPFLQCMDGLSDDEWCALQQTAKFVAGCGSLDDILVAADNLIHRPHDRNSKHFAVVLAQINLLPNHLCPCLPVTLDRFHQHA